MWRGVAIMQVHGKSMRYVPRVNKGLPSPYYWLRIGHHCPLKWMGDREDSQWVWGDQALSRLVYCIPPPQHLNLCSEISIPSKTISPLPAILSLPIVNYMKCTIDSCVDHLITHTGSFCVDGVRKRNKNVSLVRKQDVSLRDSSLQASIDRLCTADLTQAIIWGSAEWRSPLPANKLCNAFWVRVYGYK